MDNTMSLNNSSSILDNVFYSEDKPSFQDIMNDLFKTYIKSCNSPIKTQEEVLANNG